MDNLLHLRVKSKNADFIKLHALHIGQNFSMPVFQHGHVLICEQGQTNNLNMVLNTIVG